MRNPLDRTVDINWLWRHQFLPSHNRGRYHDNSIEMRRELVSVLAYHANQWTGEDYEGKPAMAAKIARMRELHRIEMFELSQLEHIEACRRAGIRGMAMLEDRYASR